MSPHSPLSNVLTNDSFTPNYEAESDHRITPRRSFRTLWLLLLLSVITHGLLVWLVPKSAEKTGGAAPVGQGPLQVTMMPPPADTAPPPLAAVPKPSVTPPSRVIASAKPSTAMPPVVDVPDSAPTPKQQAIARRTDESPQDFMAVLNARRAQRQADEDFVAKENADARNGERELTDGEKAEAGFKQNMQALGRDKDGTSGIFQIKSKSTRYAAFSFRGWTTDRERSQYELIEVDAGVGGDVELAIVRKMITLIRTHYQGSFNWESHRLGRVIALSARMEDNAGLEAFLIKEFFG